MRRRCARAAARRVTIHSARYHGGAEVPAHWPGDWRGGVEVYYPPARNLASSITITVFTAFWIGVVLVMGKVGAPLFFTGIFGFFGLLMILATLSSWLSSALIEVNSGGVTITRRFLGLGSPVLIPAHEIESIDTKQGMEANTVSYFDVKVQSKGGKPRTAGTSIKGKPAAEEIVRRMREALASR